MTYPPPTGRLRGRNRRKVVNPPGCFAEKRFLLGGRKRRGDRGHAVQDVRKRGAEAVDREVRPEHRTIGPEELDRRSDDRAVALRRPGPARLAEARHLDERVRTGG